MVRPRIGASVLALVAAAGLLALLPGVAAADHDGATVPWTSALPPLPPGQDAAPDATQRCGSDGVACVRRVERILADVAAHYGCDHRAVFATTYQLLTREIRLQLEADPSFFDDPAGLGLEAEVFLRYYLEVLDAHAAGEPVPEAWQIALDANAHGDYNAGQDMLASINAHVQRDMPYVVEEVGLTVPDGGSRKPDHDRQNEILSRAYDEIVPTIGERFDPIMLTADGGPSPVDDLTAGQLVAEWREGVWRHAEGLVAADADAARTAVEASIESNARTWAETVTAEDTPGYRAYRDAYCRARAAGASREEALAAAEDAYDPTGGDSAPEGSGQDEPPASTDTEPGSAPTTDTAPMPATGGGATLSGILALLVVFVAAPFGPFAHRHLSRRG